MTSEAWNTLTIMVATFVVSTVIAAVGWGLKEVATNLITTLVKTIGRVEILDSKLEKLIETVGDVQKIRTDLNGFYARLKELESSFSKSTDA